MIMSAWRLEHLQNFHLQLNAQVVARVSTVTDVFSVNFSSAENNLVWL